jgi:Carboxypeptidase regulatory-like domain
MKRYGLLILLALPLLSEAADSRTVTLRGRVVDDATNTGLPLVEVKVAGQQNLPAATTDGRGSYAIANVPVGTVTLEFRKPGFEYFPTSVKQTVSQAMTVDDVALIEQNAPSDDYYSRLAERDAQRARRRVSGGASPAQEYGQAWSRLEAMNISPSGRAAYARSLTALAPEVTPLTLPKLHEYAVAKPDAIRHFQAETERAIGSNARLPPRAELNRQGLTDTVIVDVAASALKKTAAPAEAKRDFVTKFGRNYGSASENKLIKMAPHGSVGSAIGGDDKKGARGDDKKARDDDRKATPPKARLERSTRER